MTKGLLGCSRAVSIPKAWHLCTVCIAQIAGQVLAVAGLSPVAAFGGFVGFCIGALRQKSLD
jgi:hypothetical protein